MQPLRGKKSLNLPGQKKSRNLLGPKQIMQPLWTNKNHAKSLSGKITQLVGTKSSQKLLGQKKSRNLSVQKNQTSSQDKKKITQPFETKKNPCNLLEKKKSHKLLGQKNTRNLSRQKIPLPLGTKKLCHLSGQKNHATYPDKKSRKLPGLRTND